MAERDVIVESVAMEGRVCKLHRRNRHGFSSRVVPDHTWQQVNRHISRTIDPRLRWSTKHILLCWIIMDWSIQGQLTERFHEGFELLSRMFDRRRHPPLCLRLIVLKRGGKRVYLLTHVLESPRLSRSMAGELYRARWGIEVAFRSLKQNAGPSQGVGPDAGNRCHGTGRQHSRRRR